MSIFPKLHEGFHICDRPSEIGIDIVMDDVAGIADIMSFLNQHSIDIIHFDWSGFSNGKAVLFLIIDISNYKGEQKDLLKELKSLSRHINNVKLSPVVNGKLVYTKSLFPLVISKSRGIMLPVGVAEGMFEVFRDHFGEDMGTSLLYHLGYAVGIRFYERLLKPLNPDSLEELIKILDAHLISLGIGIIKEFVIKSDEMLWMRVSRIWECESLKGKVNQPAGHTFRGMLSGIFEGFSGHRTVVNETECLAIGYDACKFEVTLLK